MSLFKVRASRKRRVGSSPTTGTSFLPVFRCMLHQSRFLFRCFRCLQVSMTRKTKTTNPKTSSTTAPGLASQRSRRLPKSIPESTPLRAKSHLSGSPEFTPFLVLLAATEIRRQIHNAGIGAVLCLCQKPQTPSPAVAKAAI